MNLQEFHKPFIKSLLIVAIVTVFAMVSSRIVVDYYVKHIRYQSKTVEYSSIKSYSSPESSVK